MEMELERGGGEEEQASVWGLRLESGGNSAGAFEALRH